MGICKRYQMILHLVDYMSRVNILIQDPDYVSITWIYFLKLL